MGQYSPPSEVKIEYDDANGNLIDISQFVMTFNGVKIEQINEEVSGFSEFQERFFPIGKDRMEPIEFGGVFKSGANSPDALFRRSTPETPDSPSRTVKVTWQAGSGGLYTMVETFVGRYERNPDKNALTKYLVRLQPSQLRTEGVTP